MKRLMDEGASDLERSLLDAGREVGSPERGKAKLLATMAAGGLVGVGATQAASVSKAWGAWLGSSAGKASVVVVLSVAAGGGGWAVRQHSLSAANSSQSGATSSVKSLPSLAAPPVPASYAAGAQAQPRVPDQQAADERTADALQEQQVLPRPAVAGPSRNESRRTSPRASSAPERALLEETALLENLRRAVEQNDRNLAQTLSARYWQRFSAGQLAPEARRLDERWRALP